MVRVHMWHYTGTEDPESGSDKHHHTIELKEGDSFAIHHWDGAHQPTLVVHKTGWMGGIAAFTDWAWAEVVED